MTPKEARALAHRMSQTLGRQVYVALAIDEEGRYPLLQWVESPLANGSQLIGAADRVRESHGAFYLDTGERIK